jgi:lipoprotein
MTTHTRRNRALTAVVTSLAALMLLTGCQSSSSGGDGGLGSSDTSTSSSSGASASKSTKTTTKSASPSATGTQVVQIGGPDVPDTEDASVKAAYETVQQLNRLENHWGTEGEMAPDISEDLKKFMDGEALKNETEGYAGMVAANKRGEARGSGDSQVGWIATDNAGKIEFPDGKSYEHGSIQMRVCENLSALKNPDGSASYPPEKSKRTMRASVERRADGHFYLISYRVEHYGCN